MKVEERKYNVYIANDGKEFKTEEACVNYENFNLETKIQQETVKMINARERALARINYLKANKYGRIPCLTKKIEGEEKSFDLLIHDFKQMKSGKARTKAYYQISEKALGIFNLKNCLTDLQIELRANRKDLKNLNAKIASHTRKLQELKKEK
jgi:hypothetical protein